MRDDGLSVKGRGAEPGLVGEISVGGEVLERGVAVEQVRKQGGCLTPVVFRDLGWHRPGQPGKPGWMCGRKGRGEGTLAIRKKSDWR